MATDSQKQSLLNASVSRRGLLKGAALGAAGLAVARTGLRLPPSVFAAPAMGPSNSVEPYVLPSMPGVDITPVLTVKDPVFPVLTAIAWSAYQMASAPSTLVAANSRY